MVAYLLILAVVMLVYRTNRASKIKRLRAELASNASEQARTRATEAEVDRLTRLIPAEANVPAFMEALYRSAQQSGLKQHEVVTEAAGKTLSARPGATDTSNVAKQRLKINASGSFRNFAEYLRLVQNIGRFNRITEFKLTPDNGQLKGTIFLELYSLPAKHAK